MFTYACSKAKHALSMTNINIASRKESTWRIIQFSVKVSDMINSQKE